LTLQFFSQERNVSELLILNFIPPHFTEIISVPGTVQFLRLISITVARCVALRGEIYKDADSVSISLATQRNAQP